MTDCGNEFVMVIKHEDASIGEPLLPKHAYNDDLSKTNFQGASMARTCLNLANAMSGAGVLSMPYALSQGGWLSMAVFFMVAGICCYTGILIQRCMESSQRIKTYPDIGQHAFGNKGRITIAFFLYLELYLVAVSFLILEGDNLDKLFPCLSLTILGFTIQGKQLFVILAGLVVLPTTWLRNLGVLAYISVGGVLASMVLLGCLLWSGATDVGFHESGRLFNLSGMPTVLGLFFVCFTGHAVFPTLHTSMSDGSQFSMVLLISFTLCTMIYGPMAIFGYLMYGDNLESQVTLNFPSGKIYTKIAIYTTIVNPLTKYALTTTPIATAIEESLGWNTNRSTSIFIRSLLLMSVMLIALTVPFFGYLMAFIGSFFSVTVSVIIPCICYIKIYQDFRENWLHKSIIIGIILFGFIVALVGTYTSIVDIINSL
ncbi:solute carrier family 32 (vesicular inhibitory amino acid transporter) protein [Dioscorea alata]|uniref:Solute carrier family 32 (Vesicular inhibitory amino acid transporter) protein n=1 Tax=Dioscorea alata TaxID=55571 RepID=A0ACB7U6Z5_DIOAL|nr:solute carrier family 32 (vesicular inhibitory amino acid transporter) protein [Dioscorea alata]